jgi:hypothetical protein
MFSVQRSVGRIVGTAFWMLSFSLSSVWGLLLYCWSLTMPYQYNSNCKFWSGRRGGRNLLIILYCEKNYVWTAHRIACTVLLEKSIDVLVAWQVFKKWCQNVRNTSVWICGNKYGLYQCSFNCSTPYTNFKVIQ